MASKFNSHLYSVTDMITKKIGSSLDTSSTKATLAKLRRSIGKPLSETVDIWPIIFSELPEEFIGTHGPSEEELAIITSLQILALYVQGKEGDTLLDNDREYFNIGHSLRSLRTEENRIAVDRRFNAMITAIDFDELIYHLRHLISILKSKSTETKVNYAKLAEDLYWFLRGYEENIRMAWAREYYRTDKGEQDVK